MFLLNYFFHFFSWRDCIEILFFATGFYYLITWLAREHTYRLLRSLIGYCALVVTAYILDLSAALYALLIGFPFLLIMYCIFHQEALQRNFVTYKKKTADIVSPQWLELIMQYCLIALNQHRVLRIIIEKNDDLSSVLLSNHVLMLPVSKPALDLILTSPILSAHHPIWLQAHGLIYGINSTWQFNKIPTEKQNDSLQEWHYQALWYTAKTDAIILEVDHRNYSFTVFVQGKILKELTVQQAHDTIARHVDQTTSRGSQKGTSHEISNKNDSVSDMLQEKNI